ncbi:MAG: gamma-glutamyltransferase, partial [Halanaerobiales bacterium]
MNFNEYPYSSRRKTVMARNGMVATSQPLAAQAGLNILQKGGNAVDAAIATAAALTVVEPTSNGIGGDTFALIWTDNKLKGLNSSGPAPQNISVKTIKKRGYKKIPEHGFIPITVPGAPAAWAELSDKYGSLSFEKILKPAIRYADKGYPVSPVTAKLWKKAYKKYKNKLKEKQFKNWFKTFAPNNKAPEPGEIWKSKDHATTLKEIADTRARSFYKGKLARKMVQFSNKYDGFLSLKDL